MTGWQWLDIFTKIATLIGVLIACRQFWRGAKYHKKGVQREAVKLAAEQAKELGCVILPQLADLRKRIDQSGCAYFQKSTITVNEQEIRVDWSAASPEDIAKIKEFGPEIRILLNRLEAFAIYFATDVADDKIGYLECGPAFVAIFKEHFPLFGLSDLSLYYRASQHLYWRWHKRMKEPGLTQDIQNLQNQAVTVLKKLLSNEMKPRDPLGS